jgi:Flp pilus assembly protein TadD
VDITDNLLAMLEKGQDNALLRYSLGNEYFKAGEWERAASHATQATEQDPTYSAAWKLLGKSLVKAGRLGEAVAALEQGITVAETKGDVQAAKEMRVFLKRARAGG